LKVASVFERSGRWYLRVKDAAGRWTKIPTAARTKTEARHLASEMERRNERQRLGLEPLIRSDGGGTLAELLTWWLVTVSVGKPSHEWAERTIKKHLLTSELAPLPLVAVSSERIEALLHRKEQEELSPQTVNHLRAFLRSTPPVARSQPGLRPCCRGMIAESRAVKAPEQPRRHRQLKSSSAIAS
jgi:hypothetical protein